MNTREFVPATSSEKAISVNPYDGQIIAEYAYESSAQIDASLTSAMSGYRAWSRVPVSERVALIARVSALLRRDVEKLAMMVVQEIGKPISQARAEIEKCAVMCDWYAQNSEAILRDKASTIGENAYVSYLPIGAVLAVMPWNFPLWQVLRGAVPILAGGNVYVLKHAPSVMGCAYLIDALLTEAGLPQGSFTVLNIRPEQVAAVIADARIAAVTVTGSPRAGAAIAAQAGACLKKSVLELGGSDPFIVLADADIGKAVKAAVVGRFQNTGQICIAAKRIILEECILEPFTEQFVDAVRQLKVGNPLDESVYIGPMARFDLRDELHNQVQSSIDEGATLLMGGTKGEGNGNFYAPTVLANVCPGTTSATQELFGPVASLMPCKDAEDAIRIANDSEYGLSAAIWTGDTQQGKALARRIESGGAFVNGSSASDPRVPIGGVKKSGFGRELAEFGILEFSNIQTVWVDRE